MRHFTDVSMLNTYFWRLMQFDMFLPAFCYIYIYYATENV